MNNFGSLEAILERADAELKGKQRENILAFREKADLTKRLITIVDVPGTPELDSLEKAPALNPKAKGLYEELGFKVERFFAQPVTMASDHADYRIISSCAELQKYCEHLTERGRFAVDTETTGLDPLTAELVGISIACGDGSGKGTGRSAAYIPLQASDQERCLAWDDVRPIIGPLLEE